MEGVKRFDGGLSFFFSSTGRTSRYQAPPSFPLSSPPSIGTVLRSRKLGGLAGSRVNPIDFPPLFFFSVMGSAPIKKHAMKDLSLSFLSFFFSLQNASCEVDITELYNKLNYFSPPPPPPPWERCILLLPLLPFLFLHDD